MIYSRDFATSSAIVFILLIAAVVLVSGVWVAVVLPNQSHIEEEQTIQQAVITLTDTSLTMRATADTPYSGISIYSPLPKGSLITKESGTLMVNGESLPICHLALSLGGTTELGLTSNGIWRKDGNAAGWILFPQTSYESNTLTIEIMTFLEDIAYGSTEPIPFHFSYEGSRVWLVSDSVITMTFTSENLWMQNLWQTVFQELAYTYSKRFNIEIVGDTMYISAKSGSLTLVVTEYLYSVKVGEFV